MASRPLNPQAEPFYPTNTLPHNPSHPNVSAASTSQNTKRRRQIFPSRYGRDRAICEWRGKGTTCKGKNTHNGSATRGNYVIPFPTTIEESHISNITTIIIRNIPNQFKFSDLLKILDEHCFDLNKTAEDAASYSKFDFLYLPMDYRRHDIEKRFSNLGYAFVNFTSPTAAYKFYERFNGLVWNVNTNRKTCEINAAQYQGKDALIRIFHQKVFRCKRHDFLPFVFWEARDGFNPQTEGTTVGRHIWGLPRKAIRS